MMMSVLRRRFPSQCYFRDERLRQSTFEAKYRQPYRGLSKHTTQLFYEPRGLELYHQSQNDYYVWNNDTNTWGSTHKIFEFQQNFPDCAFRKLNGSSTIALWKTRHKYVDNCDPANTNTYFVWDQLAGRWSQSASAADALAGADPPLPH
jgi:hypothetical protein